MNQKAFRDFLDANLRMLASDVLWMDDGGSILTCHKFRKLVDMATQVEEDLQIAYCKSAVERACIARIAKGQ